VAHQVIQGAQGLFHRRPLVDGMDLIQVEVVGAEPPQARLARLDDVVARGAQVVRPVTHRTVQLGGQQDLAAARPDRLAEDLLGQARGVDIRGIEEIDPALEADVHHPRCLVDSDRAHAGVAARAAERHRPQCQSRHPQAAASQESRAGSGLSHR
jgi:hypothetical protein